MSHQQPFPAPATRPRVESSPPYPPAPPPPLGALPSAHTTQPSIDSVQENERGEALLSSCEEADAAGKATGTPVAARSFFFQTLFVAVVAFPQLLAEAHIGMLLVPLVEIGKQVNTEDEHQLSWFPAAYG